METALMRMKYAFATVFVKRIIEADDVIHPEEEKFFAQWFPQELLNHLSLNTKALLFDAYVQSLDILPEQLNDSQKKEVFGLLLGASLADDFLDFREFGILEAAAKVLRIDSEEMFSMIDFFLDADIPNESDLSEEC
jgi:hypothetical protein